MTHYIAPRKTNEQSKVYFKTLHSNLYWYFWFGVLKLLCWFVCCFFFIFVMRKNLGQRGNAFPKPNSGGRLTEHILYQFRVKGLRTKNQSCSKLRAISKSKLWTSEQAELQGKLCQLPRVIVWTDTLAGFFFICFVLISRVFNVKSVHRLHEDWVCTVSFFLPTFPAEDYCWNRALANIKLLFQERNESSEKLKEVNLKLWMYISLIHSSFQHCQVRRNYLCT